jgi:DNA-binding NarL/FixJ family response regulator
LKAPPARLAPENRRSPPGAALDRSGFEIVGQASDGTELLALVREHAPDLAIVDIRMPPSHTTEGLDAAHVIRDELPDAGIVVLSAHVEVEHAKDLLASGRRIGYLLETRVTDVDDFLDTLERVANGARWSTRPWSPSSSRRASPTIRSTSSRRASARCSG